MSILKNTYGNYFPSLRSLPKSESKAQVKININKKDYHAEIDDRIFIKIDGLPKQLKRLRVNENDAITYDEFIHIFDGVPFDETWQILQQGIKGNKIITLKFINEWSDELFSDSGKVVLEKLKKEKGLHEATIKKYKLGYEPKYKRLLFPYLNYTQEGVSAINFYSTNYFELTNNYGGNRLFGFHDIFKGIYKTGDLFFTLNEFEAILLRQMGFKAVCSFHGWRDHFESYLNGFNIIVYNDELIEDNEWAMSKGAGFYCIKFGENTIADLVVNQGYDKSKIVELVRNKKPVSSSYYKNLIALRDLKNKKEFKFIELSQFFVNGVQYYGVKGRDDIHLISGNRRDLDCQEFALKNSSIKFEEKLGMDAKFSHDGIRKFLIQDYTPSESEAFKLVKKFIEDFIYLPEDINYKFMALWVLGTYIYLNFRHYPYVHLRAPRDSGKSTLLTMLSKLCFNAFYELGPTDAVIRRQISTYQSTILLDEVEKFKSNAAQKDILSILNQGYFSEGRVYRSKGEDLKAYKVYSPKMFAGINKINDVLLSRSIKVPIEQKTKSVKLKRYSMVGKLEERIQNITDELYTFGLLYSKDVMNFYKEIHTLQETDDLENRELDTWGPIFSIAKVVDKNGKLGLIKDLQEHVELDRRLKTENFEEGELKLHNFLKEYLTEENMLKKNRKKELIFSRDDLFDTAKSESVLPKAIDSINKLTTHLKENYEIESKNVDVKGDKNKKYVVTHAILDKYFPKGTKIKPTQPQTSPSTKTTKPKVVAKTKTSLYIPENVIITESAKKYKTTDEILDRIKKLNPKVNISDSKSENPKLPSLKTPEDRYHHMKKTVVLACRKSSFIETFPSPGRIIEKPNTMIKSVLNCSYQCMFCYLQTTAVRHYHQKIFVNTELIEQEIKNEFIIDPMIRSMLTLITKLNGSELNKIPGKFNVVANHARDALSNAGKNKVTEKDVINHFKTNYSLMLQDMELEYTTKSLRALAKKLDKIYQENKNFVPTFNISEYTDIVGIDHYSNQLEYFMALVQKIDQLKISFSTRSVNFSNILKYSGKNRTIITLQFDPQYVIDKYQVGASSLKERMEAAKKILSTKGFQLKISIEPIIMYKGYQKDYIDLIKNLAGNIDLNQVESIGYGGLRADGKLQTNIKNNYPKTDILKLEHDLVKPQGETKWRYPLEKRVNLYKVLKEEIEKHTKTRISLGAENPEAWEQAGITIKKASDYFYKLK